MKITPALKILLKSLRAKLQNKNAVPFDTESPFVTSGLRFGTPAATTRGFKEEECRFVAQKIVEVIANPNDEEFLTRTHDEIKDLCVKFPVYPHLRV